MQDELFEFLVEMAMISANTANGYMGNPLHADPGQQQPTPSRSS